MVRAPLNIESHHPERLAATVYAARVFVLALYA